MALQKPSPLGYWHPKRMAVKCGHTLHPSTPNSSYCSRCIISLAKKGLDDALHKLMRYGGLKPQESSKDRAWRNARLSYKKAKRQMHKAEKKEQLRQERVSDWVSDFSFSCIGALALHPAHYRYTRPLSQLFIALLILPQDERHKRADIANSDKDWASTPGAPCPVCSPEANAIAAIEAEYRCKVDKHVAWCERPGTLAVELPLRPKCKTTHELVPSKPKGSLMTRTFISQTRAEHVAAQAEIAKAALRQRIESAYRWKVQTKRYIHEAYWETPQSAGCWLLRLAEDRRRPKTRQPKVRPHPFTPSPLSTTVQSIDDFDADESICQEEEQARYAREVGKVGAEVGYLYFVGAGHGRIEHYEDLVRSNHSMVKRNPLPPAPLPSSFLDAEMKDAEYKDAEYKDAEYKDAEYKDAEYKDAEYKDAEYKDAEYKNAEYKNAEYNLGVGIDDRGQLQVGEDIDMEMDYNPLRDELLNEFLYVKEMIDSTKSN
ncbi:hypothetical protein BU23DRAFT_555000 [Bimuria novae-zelandiae CBS 107.79]|uniref:Uncharacterized protein n=1 Tax=Bimuria novae-zelandiae CBS 107.79 TaxID=1447943 RepID=A0A6A5V6H2_9PLEO|nr:hypothetical protein BU23DRAFT_555000 [Bimuria novae-zelandiae CBS 107.79]